MRNLKIVSRVLLGVVSLLGPSQAMAQSDPETGSPVVVFSEIASRVNVNSGGSVIVTDSSGRQVKGKLTALSSDTLTLLTDGRTLTFRDQQVREVRHRLPDSKLEGAWIGLAAGWIVPAAVCASRSDSSETVSCVLGTAFYGGLPGFFIGMGIDAMQAKTVTVFRSPSSTMRIRVAPLLAQRSKSVALVLSF